ncbi:helix-turn-helix domain-containing protein [Streptomyces sp. RerS4]|uniref:helix-turn-helix domain-containing protein n=1 Tax=Streptomyces sp. RerS4 TaxID=2942449 RepID=UPI00201BD14C|nr:helix-turn-helix domain-containing protein [Streptomyces sp. RerS4]UQX04794.1 helix-turn-helix domain-containing protein [Streptomyces sp. RerS4]
MREKSTVRKIAADLRRSPSTISREIGHKVASHHASSAPPRLRRTCRCGPPPVRRRWRPGRGPDRVRSR